jgi:hypothetical protein
MVRSEPLTITEWIQYGIEHKFCSPVLCMTHDGPDDKYLGEDFDYDDGCIPFLQLIDNHE